MRRTGTMELPICSTVRVRSRSSDQKKETHASSIMQDNKLVYWNAFTTRKFPSTSHAAKMKSRNRLEETE